MREKQIKKKQKIQKVVKQKVKMMFKIVDHTT